MTDDRLLKELGALARRQQAQDPLVEEWDDLSHNELSDTQLNRLKQTLSKAEAARAEEAFRPLDPSFIETIQNKVAPQLVGEADNVTSISHRSWRIPMAFAATMLLAVGLLFNLSPPQEALLIPEYSAVLQGGSEFRSDNPVSKQTSFQRGDKIEFQLTPATSIDGEIDVIMLTRRGAAIERLSDVEIFSAPSGAVKIVCQVGTTFPGAFGEYEVLVAVGRAEALPEPEKLYLMINEQLGLKQPGWQAWKFVTHVTP